MSCKCMEKLGKKLEKDERKPILETTFSMGGKVYPYLSAVYEKKSGRGFRTMHVIVLPIFCPFCGKRYEKVKRHTSKEGQGK